MKRTVSRPVNAEKKHFMVGIEKIIGLGGGVDFANVAKIGFKKLVDGALSMAAPYTGVTPDDFELGVDMQKESVEEAVTFLQNLSDDAKNRLVEIIGVPFEKIQLALEARGLTTFNEAEYNKLLLQTPSRLLENIRAFIGSLTRVPSLQFLLTFVLLAALNACTKDPVKVSEDGIRYDQTDPNVSLVKPAINGDLPVFRYNGLVINELDNNTLTGFVVVPGHNQSLTETQSPYWSVVGSGINTYNDFGSPVTKFSLRYTGATAGFGLPLDTLNLSGGGYNDKIVMSYLAEPDPLVQGIGTITCPPEITLTEDFQNTFGEPEVLCSITVQNLDNVADFRVEEVPLQESDRFKLVKTNDGFNLVKIRNVNKENPETGVNLPNPNLTLRFQDGESGVWKEKTVIVNVMEHLGPDDFENLTDMTAVVGANPYGAKNKLQGFVTEDGAPGATKVIDHPAVAQLGTAFYNSNDVISSLHVYTYDSFNQAIADASNGLLQKVPDATTPGISYLKLVSGGYVNTQFISRVVSGTRPSLIVAYGSNAPQVGTVHSIMGNPALYPEIIGAYATIFSQHQTDDVEVFESLPFLIMED